MPPFRGWITSPTRRELTLVLFALIIFILSYNLETSLQLVGVHPAKLSSTYLSTIGLGTTAPGLERDGRRPPQWRDELENAIFGEWEWEEGKVSGVDRPSTGRKLGGTDPGDAFYNADYMRRISKNGGRDGRGVGVTMGVSPREQFLRWDEIPETKAIAHVPGYTILDGAIVTNGTIFLVTDTPSSLPPLHAMGSSAVEPSSPPRSEDWQVLTKAEAREKLGTYGGRIFGTTWISTDSSQSQDPYTLFSFFRTHSATSVIASSFTPSGLHILSPSSSADAMGKQAPTPLRIIYTRVPTFSSPEEPLPPGSDEKAHPPMRIRSYNGMHPLLPKAILPATGVWYMEDWEDLEDMNVPWFFDRIVVADRGAAERGRSQWEERWVPGDVNRSETVVSERADGDEGKPAWVAPFVGLDVHGGEASWWAPIRSSLLRFLHMEEPQEKKSSGFGWGKKSSKPKPILTYVSMQDEPPAAGPRLNDEDHEKLVEKLRGLEKQGVLSEVHIVKGNGTVDVHGWEWEARMRAIARSSIVIGTYGPHLADGIFMIPPNPVSSTGKPAQEERTASLLMEFYPPGTFLRDQESAVRALGMRYMAWWKERKFMGNSLPPVLPPHTDFVKEHRVPLDVDAVVQVIREEASRRTA